MFRFATHTSTSAGRTPSVAAPKVAVRSPALAVPVRRPSSVRELIPSAGSPLEERLRGPAEKHLRFDFRSVRVHTGADADRMTRGVDARAYTLGNHIVFRSGEFASTEEGRRTLHHELAHVAQQRGQLAGSPSDVPAIGHLGDASEREADEIAETFVSGEGLEGTQSAVTNHVDPRPVLRRRPAGGNTFGNWDVETVPMHAPAAGGDYNYRIRIMFQPNAANVDSPEIAFVQAVNITDTGTHAGQLPAGLAQRQSAAGWSVDSVTKRGWVGYDDANNPYAVPRPGGLPAAMIVEPGSSPTPLRNAVTRDWPGWNVPNLSWAFDTAAIARRGADAGTVYGAVTWGFVVDGVNHLNPLPIGFHDAPGPAWRGATDAWNRQARGPAANRAAPDQQPLPAFTFPAPPEPAAP